MLFLLVCATIVARTDLSTDLSAFLPRSPTPAQQVLVDQLRDGVVARTILVGIEGGPPQALAQASRALAAKLRVRPAFVAVDNGDNPRSDADRDYLWRNRYLLSGAVNENRFRPAALRESLERQLRLLGTPAGMMLQRLLPADPTGELLALAAQAGGGARPHAFEGVWFSGDRARALIAVQTAAAGYDIDAQERALGEIREAFAAVAPEASRLLMTGPGVFSVESRATIKNDVSRLATLALLLISALLLVLYRSPRVLVLGLLPVASGALAGVAAVSLGFGTVHGVTLGFGITLIGEGVDYAIYLFTQNAPGTDPRATLGRIWPTLRLGVLTSICGFGAMFASGFPGLAQLGLFSIAGLVVAATVTRWVLPSLMPAGFTAAAVPAVAPLAMAGLRYAPRLRSIVLLAVALGAAVLLAARGELWHGELASLSPVSVTAQRLDQELRAGMGAPDVRHLVVINAADRESALRAAETVGTALDGAIARGWLQGYETPAAWLPSRHAQAARQAALPAPEVARARLDQALRGLPFRAGTFEPFLEDLEAARRAPPVDRARLDGTRLAVKVDALLVSNAAGWAAMLPLRGVTRPEAIAGAIGGAGAVFLDLKHESDALYRSYLREALSHALIGAVAITILLFLALRSPRRVFAVLAPLGAAVIVTAAVLALAGFRLTIFHLVGLLLVVAVGSNYALFFDRQVTGAADRERTAVSLLFANLTTMLGFGLLSFSSVPVLQALGATVGLGAVLALVFSAMLHRSPADAR